MEGYPHLVAEMEPNPNHRPERQIPMVNRLTGEFSAPAPQGIFPKVWDFVLVWVGALGLEPRSRRLIQAPALLFRFHRGGDGTCP